MKKILPYLSVFVALSCGSNPQAGETKVRISFKNSSADVCHFGLAAYIPDGKLVTRVSNVAPYHTKTYSFPIGTSLYLLNREQEETVMQGTDLQKRGDKPRLVLTETDNESIIIVNE